MKKLISILTLFLLMMSLAFAAGEPPIPAPVKIIVSINGMAISYDAKATNEYTGEVLTVAEVPSLRIQPGTVEGRELGVGNFDLSEFKKGYFPAGRGYAGDSIKVEICNVHPSCTQRFNVLDSSPKEIRVAIVDSTIIVEKPVEKVVEKIIEKIICEDGTEVDDADNCTKITPIEPITIIEKGTDTTTTLEKIICADGREVLNKEDCEDEISGLWKALIVLAIAILSAFGWAKGFTALAKYWFNKGKEFEKAGNKTEAKKCYERAAKMLKTALVRAKEGYYKKG